MKNTLRRTFLGSLVLAAVMAAFGRVEAQSAQEVWQVEIDIYSGVRNPIIALTAAELTQVKDRLGRGRALADANVPTTVRPSRLGYRGMIVRGKAADQKRVTAYSEVFNHRILQKAPAARALFDDSAGLESYLVWLAESRKLLPAADLAEIRKVVP
jgi:hypothetical protein